MTIRKAAIAALMAAQAAFLCTPTLAEAPELPANPTIADKKAFLAAIIGDIDGTKTKFPPGGVYGPPVCKDLMGDLRRGEVTFLEPVAFDAAKTPQAVKEIEKRCPNFDVGITLGSEGQRYYPTRNIALYQLPFSPDMPLSPDEITPVFFGEGDCEPKGGCDERMATLQILNPPTCEKQRLFAWATRPHFLTSLVRIGADFYVMSLVKLGASTISLSRIPRDKPVSENDLGWLKCQVGPELER